MACKRSLSFVCGVVALSVVLGVELPNAGPPCPQGSQCANQGVMGLSVLQHKVERSKAETTSEDFENELESNAGKFANTENLQTASTTVQVLANEELVEVQITIHDGSEVQRSGSGTWIIEVPKGCNTTDVQGMGKNMPDGSVDVYEGNPDKGGLCIFLMNGTLQHVKDELASHKWPSAPIVESDLTWGIIPDNRTQTSLLEADGTNPPWGLDRIDDINGLDQDFSPQKNGEGTHVYVLDTGIRTTHDDFGGRAIPTLEALGRGNVVCSSSDPTCAVDRQGHGTHCAGTIGGTKYGVAKKAKLHAVKVLSDQGSGSFSWFAEAIDWVMQNGEAPAIISASLGGPGHIQSVNDIIASAVAGGVSVVVAAGNEGGTNRPNACDYSPARAPRAITVGSTTRSDSRSYFSNIGSCVDIFAPGSDILSTGVHSDQATDTMSGTSMACPHVAGVVALVRQTGAGATDAESIIKSMATSGKISDLRSGSPDKFLHIASSLPTPPGTETTFTNLGEGQCVTSSGRVPTYTYMHGAHSQCKPSCQKSANCHGYSLSTYGNCILWMQEGLKGGGASWGSASCYVKDKSHTAPVPAPTPPATFADLGEGKCLTLSGGVPKHEYVHGAGSQCRPLCQKKENCYGYSLSSYRNCLLWMQEGLKGGGAGWGGARCYVKEQ